MSISSPIMEIDCEQRLKIDREGGVVILWCTDLSAAQEPESSIHLNYEEAAELACLLLQESLKAKDWDQTYAIGRKEGANANR